MLNVYSHSQKTLERVKGTGPPNLTRVNLCFDSRLWSTSPKRQSCGHYSRFLAGALNRGAHPAPLSLVAQSKVFLSSILDPLCHPTLQRELFLQGREKEGSKGRGEERK